MKAMSRRKFLALCPAGAVMLSFSGCDERARRIFSASLRDLQEQGYLPPDADAYLTGDQEHDIRQATNEIIQAKIKRIADGSGEELVIAVKNTDNKWEIVVAGRAEAKIGGADYAHPYFRIRHGDAIHASLAFAGGFFGIGLTRTIALQFRNAAGQLLGQAGAPAHGEEDAMSWSIFSGKQVAKPVQEGAGESFFDTVVKLFAVAVGAFLVVIAGKWALGLVGFLLGQLLMFLAAAAAVGVIISVLKLVGFDLLTSEGREKFVQFLKDLFAKVIEAALITFNQIKAFLDLVNFATWPPQIPEGAFD